MKRYVSSILYSILIIWAMPNGNFVSSTPSSDCINVGVGQSGQSMSRSRFLAARGHRKSCAQLNIFEAAALMLALVE